MARRENDLTACMITQRIDSDEFWNWTDKSIIQTGDVRTITWAVVQLLEKAGMVVVEAYGIIHGQDVRQAWDEIASGYVLETKPKHIHIDVKFEKGRGGTIAQIASAIGLEPQFIEKPQRGRYAWDNLLAYLTHIKYADKHQYEPSEVHTERGESYQKVYHERKEEWLKGRAKVSAQKAKIDIDWLEQMILSGEVTKQQVILTDQYFEIYARNKRRCDEAFDTYGQRKVYKTIQAMENGEFRTSVIFVTGAPGSGKSFFTDMLVKQIQTERKEKTGDVWSVCSVASNNPFDEYNGEEILVMDDLRGISLTASDWLKLLDPERINMGSARYHNKRMACRVVIINSEKDVVDFFYYSKQIGGGSGRDEALDQFIRRIMARAVVYRVPDSADRRVGIGTVKRVDTPYQIENPGNPAGYPLTLHYTHKEDVLEDLQMEDAAKVITEQVARNNDLNRKQVQFQPGEVPDIDVASDDFSDCNQSEDFQSWLNSETAYSDAHQAGYEDMRLYWEECVRGGKQNG